MTYAESYAFTYRVTDVDGDAVTLTFTIAVNGIPSFVREEEDQQYTAGNEVSLELPEAVGGNVARTYRLDGSCRRVCRLIRRLGRFRVRRRSLRRMLLKGMR